MPLTTTLLEFILGLLRDPAAAEAYHADPEGTLADHGLGDVCSDDVAAVMPALHDFAPISSFDREYNTGGNSAQGGDSHVSGGGVGGVSTTPTPAPTTPAADHAAAVTQLTHVVNSYSYTEVDDRDVMLDQSVNQNIWAAEGFSQTFNQSANVISGDHNNMAGGDLLDDDSEDTTISAGGHYVGGDYSYSPDSGNTSTVTKTDTTTVTKDSGNIEFGDVEKGGSVQFGDNHSESNGNGSNNGNGNVTTGDDSNVAQGGSTAGDDNSSHDDNSSNDDNSVTVGDVDVAIGNEDNDTTTTVGDVAVGNEDNDTTTTVGDVAVGNEDNDTTVGDVAVGNEDNDTTVGDVAVGNEDNDTTYDTDIDTDVDIDDLNTGDGNVIGDENFSPNVEDNELKYDEGDEVLVVVVPEPEPHHAEPAL